MKRKFTPNTAGLFESVPMEAYQSAPGLSKSALDYFRDCPAKYRAWRDGDIAKRATPAMIKGALLHSAILENEFDYYVRPDTRSDGKPWTNAATECKEWTDAHADKIIISPEEDEEIRLVARHVRKHPLAWPLLKGSRREVSMFAEYGGQFMKGRADALNLLGWLVDIKKTEDASNHALERTIFQYGYHIQFALYHKLCALNGVAVNGSYIVAIELGETKCDQCLLNVRKVKPSAIEIGLRELEAMLTQLNECERIGVWPDYSGAAVGEIDLPRFVYGEQDLTGVEEV